MTKVAAPVCRGPAVADLGPIVAPCHCRLARVLESTMMSRSLSASLFAALGSLVSLGPVGCAGAAASGPAASGPADTGGRVVVLQVDGMKKARSGAT